MEPSGPARGPRAGRFASPGRRTARCRLGGPPVARGCPTLTGSRRDGRRAEGDRVHPAPITAQSRSARRRSALKAPPRCGCRPRKTGPPPAVQAGGRAGHAPGGPPWRAGSMKAAFG
jgi:hypothetical protein